MNIVVRNKTLKYDSHTLIMGILNITEDSFSGDGILDFKLAINQAKNFINSGAEILDIGGESSKPGALPITEEEEIIRIMPLVEYLVQNTESIISVDTYKLRVAQQVLSKGAHIINDIKGLRDPKMADLIAKYNAGIIIMHMKGDPNTMQINPHYENVVEEIIEFFDEKIKVALTSGITKDKIILDPGIGFGKTLENNLDIIKNLSKFKDYFNLPILLGTSRKSFIGKITGKENSQDRVFGTAASIAIAIANGANIVRVHDVAEMSDVVKVVDKLVY